MNRTILFGLSAAILMLAVGSVALENHTVDATTIIKSKSNITNNRMINHGNTNGTNTHRSEGAPLKGVDIKLGKN